MTKISLDGRSFEIVDSAKTDPRTGRVVSVPNPVGPEPVFVSNGADDALRDWDLVSDVAAAVD